MTRVNKLAEIYAKAEYAVGAVSSARKEANHPGSLWYHAIGLFNAFYAINEELQKRTKNSGDLRLAAAINAWWDANGSTVKAFFGSARNTATHQGEIITESFLEWEWDIPGDTKHPVTRASVTVKNSSIDRMPGLEFLDLCERALTFMQDGILSIDADYKLRGGTDHALSEERHHDIF